LRNQLGSRGYIEQSILDRVAEQSAGDLIDEVTAFSNKEARSELARQGLVSNHNNEKISGT
jgi:hypothetical protein